MLVADIVRRNADVEERSNRLARVFATFGLGRGDRVGLIGYAGAALAGYKRPRSVAFVESLPLSPTGKVLKRELRAPWWAGRERRI